MNTKKSMKILIVFIILLIIGVLISIFNGFKLSFNYDNVTRIEIGINKQLDFNEVNNFIRELYPEEQLKVEMIGVFKDTIGITMKEINAEKSEHLIEKLNEKYGTQLNTADTQTYIIPASNLYDMIEPYIWPTSIAFVITLIASCITYRKNGILKTILAMLVLIIGAEILYAIFISIFNIKLTQTIFIGAVGIMIFVTIYLTRVYEKNYLPK